jgi:N-acyl-D-aspartate/D-glutamate deacylase
MSDLLVRGGTVVDGTGAPGRAADVRIRDGRITEVGPGLRLDGENELDASGALVTPGFIDTHTHYDPSLFWDSFGDPMPLHGVTTLLIGSCSLSLAPVRAAQRDLLTEVFCYIEDLPTATFDAAIPWTWESYRDYLPALQGDGLGLNVVTLVGHTATHASQPVQRSSLMSWTKIRGPTTCAGATPVWCRLRAESTVKVAITRMARPPSASGTTQVTP